MNDIPASQDMASQHSPSVDEQIALEATPPAEHGLKHLEAGFIAEFKKAEIFAVDSLHELEAVPKRLLAWVAAHLPKTNDAPSA